jgi:hypothetical protein
MLAPQRSSVVETNSVVSSQRFSRLFSTVKSVLGIKTICSPPSSHVTSEKSFGATQTRPELSEMEHLPKSDEMTYLKSRSTYHDKRWYQYNGL